MPRFVANSKSLVDMSSHNVGWTQIGVDIDGEADDDYSGRSVSLSGDGKTVAIGSYGRGSGQKNVFFFKWP